MGCFVAQILQLYTLCLFARIVLSWFPLAPGGAMSSIFGVLYNLTEPVLGPVRQILPSVGMIDLSPIVVFIVINILSSSIC
ncbi:MAG TPA: YggT family protein [Acidimicrobiales bacterium]|nr:YggT family protein [Acidimicrobiales bacterium]